MSLLPRILLLDDSPDDRELVSLVLRGAFGEVAIEEVSDAAELARAVSLGHFGAVLTEHELPWISARDVLRLIRDLRPECPVLVVTRRPVEDVATELLHLAPDGLIPKTATGWVGLPRALRSALFQARRRAARDGGEAPSRRLLDALPAGVLTASGEGTILDANPALAKLLGYGGPEDCAQRPLSELFASAAELDDLLERLAGGGRVEADARLRRADARSMPVKIQAWREPASAPRAGGRVHALIMERDAGSDDATTRAPPRSRTELDEMAYAVSHDLRQPLHQVIRLLELLEQEAGKKLGDEGETLLGQARQSASRLDGMVDAMLRCARIESSRDAPTDVDLDEVLARVLERLEPERALAGAEVEHGPLPVVRGDEGQLELLLQNLLDNALKFHGKAPARVQVDAEDEGDSWHLRVRDNGIGIAAQDTDRIFQLFQRLHTADEVPGSGIGLAVCRRVVARHGGRIWVESKPGKGSTFHFTLAKRASPRPGASRE